jgi:hypothetical protein
LYHHQESQELRHQSPLETEPSHRDPAVNDVFVLPADSLSLLLLVIIITRTRLCSSLGITIIIIIIGLSNCCCWQTYYN